MFKHCTSSQSICTYCTRFIGVSWVQLWHMHEVDGTIFIDTLSHLVGNRGGFDDASVAIAY